MKIQVSWDVNLHQHSCGTSNLIILKCFSVTYMCDSQRTRTKDVQNAVKPAQYEVETVHCRHLNIPSEATVHLNLSSQATPIQEGDWGGGDICSMGVRCSNKY